MSRITTIALGTALAAALAACSAGGLPASQSPGATSAQPTTPTVTTTPTATPGATPETTPRPTEVPGPPVALLVGGRGGPATGELGTFFWDGLGSDSPWIVPSGSVTAAPAAALGVVTDPAIAPERWTASWAPLVDGKASTPRAATDGSGAVVALEAPGEPGSWGLLVELRFAGGQRAAWYWSVGVAP